MSEEQKQNPKPHGWRPWGDHPFIVFIVIIGVLIGLITSVITIYNFVFEKSLPIANTTNSNNITTSETRPKIRISIEKESLYINGKAVNFPIDLSDLEKIVREPGRLDTEYPEVYAWKDYGFYCVVSMKDNKVAYLNIQICDPVIYDYSQSSIKMYQNKNKFWGFLSIDGVMLNADSDISFVNKYKRGNLFKQLPAQPETWQIKYGQKRISYSSGKGCSLVYIIDHKF